jgi:two-component system sensor histidine kinase BaeS
LRLYTAPLDLLPLLRQSVEIHRARAQEQGIELLLDVPDALPAVVADRERLAQVLGNLLSNGLRYVPRGGRIVVRAAVQGAEVVVSVADNGPGVQADEIEHLFERFWRSDPARQRATGGSGLGLAVAQHIIKGHSGRIWAEQTPGGGLTGAFALGSRQA